MVKPYSQDLRERVIMAVAEGKLSQIGPTMESGRKYGMVPLNDALVACVKSGEVDARENRDRADRRREPR